MLFLYKDTDGLACRGQLLLQYQLTPSISTLLQTLYSTATVLYSKLTTVQSDIEIWPSTVVHDPYKTITPLKFIYNQHFYSICMYSVYLDVSFFIDAYNLFKQCCGPYCGLCV